MAKSTVVNYTILLVMVEAETNDQNVFSTLGSVVLQNLEGWVSWKGDTVEKEVAWKR